MAAGSTGVWSLQTGQSCRCLPLAEPQVTCSGGSETKDVALSTRARHAPSPAPGCFHTSGPARAAKGCQTRPCPQLCPTAWSPWRPPSTPGETEKVLVSLCFPLEWPRELGCSARAAAIWPDPSSFLRKDPGLQPRPSGSRAHKPSHPQVLPNHGPLAAWRFCPKGPDVLRSVCELRPAPRSAGWPLLPEARLHLC